MRTLLDTCVLSELRHPSGNEGVRRLVAELANEDLFVSVISMGEIVKGIALLETSRRQQKKGRTIPVCNGLIAATAQRHGLHLMTRNTSDLESTGVLLINPWS